MDVVEQSDASSPTVKKESTKETVPASPLASGTVQAIEPKEQASKDPTVKPVSHTQRAKQYVRENPLKVCAAIFTLTSALCGFGGTLAGSFIGPFWSDWLPDMAERLFTDPARIDDLALAKEQVGIGESVLVFAAISNPDGHKLNHNWVTPKGIIITKDNWPIPKVELKVEENKDRELPADVTIQLKIDDGLGRKDERSTTIRILSPIGRAVEIHHIKTDRPGEVTIGKKIWLEAMAHTSGCTQLNYKWETEEGQIIGQGPRVIFDTSGISLTPHEVNVKLTVTIPQGMQDTKPIPINVRPPALRVKKPPTSSEIEEALKKLHAPKPNN